MAEEMFTVDEITIINEQVPVGDYKARLVDATGELSKSKQKPTVYATWEIVAGEHEGKETRSFYSLAVTRKQNKKGVMQTYAGGIADYTAAMRLVKPQFNGTWPVNPTLELAEQAAVGFKKAFSGKVVNLKVMPNNYTDDSGQAVNGTRVKVIGTGGGVPVAAAAVKSGVDMFDDL
jgi:hypothetical protein